MIENNPLISVVIPLYNKASTIKDTVLSVLSQTFQNFELIVVNDGSTDNSIEVLSEINDNRIRTISKKNGGVSEARNYGIKNSKSSWVFFLDADDSILDNCLEVLLELSRKYPEADILTSSFEMITVKGKSNFCKRTIEGYIHNPFMDFWKRNIFPRTGNILIKKKCFEKMDVWFNPKISIYEDLDFMIRLLDKFKVAYTPQSIYIYDTTHSALSVSGGSLERQFAFFIKLDNNLSYKNLLLSENVFYSIISRFKDKDFQSFFILLKRNFNRIHIIIYSFIYKRLFVG